MEQLLYEFVEQNGSYLMFYREDGLRSTELHALQVRMLRQNTIEQLLPVEFDESDFVIRLRYRISDKKMLSQVLQYRRLTMSEYYEILLRTVVMLDDCRMYMLDEEKHVLHEDFIFVGEELTDVYFVYLPTDQLALSGSVQERLKNLATTLIAFVDGMEAEGFQAILQYFYTQAFSLAGFKELLHRIEITAKPDQPKGQELGYSLPNRRTMPAALEARTLPHMNEQQDRHTGYNQEPRAVEESAAKRADPFLNALSIGLKEEKEKNKKPRLADKERDRKIRNIMLAVGTVGLALTLKSVIEKGPAGLLSVYTFLLVGAIGYLLFKDRLSLLAKRRKDKGEPEGDGAAGAQKEAEQTAVNSVQEAELDTALRMEQPSQESRAVRAIGPEVPTEHYYEVLHLYTEMLGDSKVFTTSKLGFDNKEQEDQEQALSYLVIKREGLLERIAIYKDIFLIGSQEETVHYHEEGEGISRTHLEIIKKSGKNVARDLGSRNGTYLNESKMAPYKEYLLSDGDRLQVAQSEFQFFYTLSGSNWNGDKENMPMITADQAGVYHEQLA